MGSMKGRAIGDTFINMVHFCALISFFGRSPNRFGWGSGFLLLFGPMAAMVVVVALASANPLGDGRSSTASSVCALSSVGAERLLDSGSPAATLLLDELNPTPEDPAGPPSPSRAEGSRRYILIMLAGLDDGRIAPVALDAFADPDFFVRKAAIDCAARQGIDNKVVHEALAGLLAQGEALGPMCHRAAIDAVGYSGADWARPTLENVIVYSGDSQAAAAARQALARLDILRSGARDLLILGILEAGESAFYDANWLDDLEWACWMGRKLQLTALSPRLVDLGRRLHDRGVELEGEINALKAHGQPVPLLTGQLHHCTRVKALHIRRLLVATNAASLPGGEETLRDLTKFLGLELPEEGK